MPQAADITMSMWRCTDSSKVWYEWALASPTQSHIHNPGGPFPHAPAFMVTHLFWS